MTMRPWRWVLAALALTCSACVVDLGLGGGASVACVEQRDCPDGYRCEPNLGVCVSNDTDDGDAPEVEASSVAISPSAAGEGSPVFISFRTNEVLGAVPVLALRDANGGNAVNITTTVLKAEEQSFICVYRPTGDEGPGEWTVIASLVDRAGNRNPTAVVGLLRLDFQPPDLLGAPSLSKAQLALGDTTEISLTPSEPLRRTPRAYLRWDDDLPARLLSGGAVDGQGRYTFTYAAQGDEPAGTTTLVVELTDAAGNVSTRERVLPLVFDFVPPFVESVQPVEIIAAPDSLVSAVEHVTYGTTYVLRFIASEPLATEPEVRVHHAALSPAIDPRLVPMPSVGGIFEYAWELAPHQAYPQGAYTLTAVLTDLAGNVRAETLVVDRPLVVDTEPPAPPNVDAPDVIRYLRVPWGAHATGGSAAFTLSGGAGALPACQPSLPLGAGKSCHFLIAFAQREVDPESELGRVSAQLDGSFASFALTTVDVVTLWVSTADAAGNVSDADGDAANGAQAVAVRDVTWVASLAGKVAGSTVANPHTLLSTPIFRPSLGQDETRTEEPVLSPGLGERLRFTDGAGVRADSRRVWTQRFSTSLKPSPRTGHATAYDTERARVVLFGGRDAVGELQDVWEWDGTRWEQIFAEGVLPSPRANHAMAYDPARGNVVLFGGLGVSGHLSNETWLWNGASWIDATPSDPAASPPPRRAHRMVYFPERGTVVLFGGLSQQELDDVWEWNGQAWTQAGAGAPTPPARWNHAMTYDARAGVVLMYGGRSVTPKADFWRWDGTTWTEIEFLGARPSPAFVNRMVFDPVREVTVLFGEQTWEWSGVRWTSPTPPTEPSPRDFGELEFDAVRQRVVLFGGDDAAGDCNDTGVDLCRDVWEWGGSVWVDVTPGEALVPEPRDKHAMAYDSARLQSVMFGGSDGPFIAGTWAWTGANWVNLAPSLEPQLRIRSAMVFEPTNERVILFGGLNSAGACTGAGTTCGDTWRWTGSQWFPVTPFATPPSRHSHSMAFVSHPVTLQCPHAPLPPATTQASEPFALVDGSTLSIEIDGASPAQTVTFTSADFANIASASASEVADAINAQLLGGTASAAGIVSLASDSGGSVQVLGGSANGALGFPVCIDNLGTGTLLFGGSRGTAGATGRCAAMGDCNDTWLLIREWPTAGSHTWVDMSAASPQAPSPRSRHATTYDESRGVVVLFGGLDGASLCAGDTAAVGRACSDTWEWGRWGASICGTEQGTCWREVTPNPPVPAGRSSHTLVYDRARQRVVLHGGQLADGGETTDTWEWDGSRWVNVTAPDLNPPVRFAHSAAYDSTRKKVVVFAGSGRRDTWELDADPEQRPALVTTFDWRFASAPTQSVMAVEVDAIAAGVGFVTTSVETAVAGAALLIWQPERNGWVPVGTNDAEVGSEGSLIPFTSNDPMVSRALFDDDAYVHVAVQPLLPMGNGSTPAAVALDYVELRVKYRLPEEAP